MQKINEILDALEEKKIKIDSKSAVEITRIVVNYLIFRLVFLTLVVVLMIGGVVALIVQFLKGISP